jgi:hypothetical protein
LCENWGRSNKEAERECHMKHRIQNPESDRRERDASDRDDRSPRKAGRGGWKPRCLPGRDWFLPDNHRLFPLMDRFFPGLPASSRLFPHNFFGGQAEQGLRSQKGESSVDLCGKINGFYRDVSGFIGYYRTREAHNYAFSRFLSIRAFLDANLASQARHEMGAQIGCSLARSVVAN